jgi:DNA modification methylase
MAKNKEDPKLTRLTDHIEDTISDEEEIETVKLPQQDAFFKMPKRFGTVPDVSKKPLGWGKGGYEHLYPHVNLPAQRLDTLSFGVQGDPNKLYWGDNLHVMRTLPSESIDLIYIDPPFFSGRDYKMIFEDQNEIITFKDIWDGGLPTYQIWLNARLVEMKRLLKKTGSIYVHLDWHASHYIKVEMDKIFGYDNFRNEIVWCYTGPRKSPKAFARKHDTIFSYTKSDDYVFNEQRIAHKSGVHNTGQVFGSMEKGDEEIREELEKKGKLLEDWWVDIWSTDRYRNELLGYPTQKPEALLERIIKASSKEGDVVADFFCGGGTTPAVAQSLGRRWIACDLSRIAVEVTKGRVLRLLKSEKGIQKTFSDIHNIEVWSWGFYDAEKLQDVTDEEFKDFIIRAYGGRPIANEFINGTKNGIPLLVGNKSRKIPISKKEVFDFAQYIQENYELNKTGTILAWGFSDSAIKAQTALANIGAEINFIKIKNVRIGSYEFIEDVVTKNKEYKNVFRFVFPPEVVLNITKENGEFVFDFSDSVSLNNGKIINIQADFDFEGKFVPSTGYIFNPYTMVLKHKLSSVGKKKIAFKVEDDQGGEKLVVREVE